MTAFELSPATTGAAEAPPVGGALRRRLGSLRPRRTVGATRFLRSAPPSPAPPASPGGDATGPDRRTTADDPAGAPIGAAPGSRRRLVLGMAAVTVAVAVAGQVGALPHIPLGGLELSMSLLPALALGVACGDRLLGRSTARPAAVGYWVAMAIMLPSLAIAFARSGRLDLWVGLLAAAAQEELVYRLAGPAIIALALRGVGVGPGRARIAGLTLAGAWFVLLPGHLAQMTSPLAVAPYIAFATLAAIIVHRSGSILPVAAGHAVVNMATVLMWNETVAADQRGMWLACTLGLLVLAYGRPRRLTLSDEGGLVDTRTGHAVSVIDLRQDGEPVAVLADGTRLPIDIDAAGTDSVDHHR